MPLKNVVKNPTCPYVVLRAKPAESLLKTGIRSFAIAKDDKEVAQDDTLEDVKSLSRYIASFRK